MKSKTAFIAILGLAFALWPAAISARPCDSVAGREIPRKHLAELNLTADQKEKLKELRKDWMESAKPVFEQMKSVREKAKAELLKKEPSKQVLDDYAVQMGDLHKQLAQKLQAHLLQVKSVLSAQQFEKMLSFDWMGPGPGMGPRPGMDGDSKRHCDKGMHCPNKTNK